MGTVIDLTSLVQQTSAALVEARLNAVEKFLLDNHIDNTTQELVHYFTEDIYVIAPINSNLPVEKALEYPHLRMDQVLVAADNLRSAATHCG